MNIYKYKKYIPIGISLPTKIVEALDKKRKDVSRSRYILRILENDILINSNLKEGFV